MEAAHYGEVVAVAASADHGFTKRVTDIVDVIAGIGIAGDAHAGPTVQHRSRVAVDPGQPNLRQVHLIAIELLDELNQRGYPVEPGQLGENFTVRGIDLLSLPTGTVLAVGSEARLELTGLRNPCHQIDEFMPGLLAQVVERRKDGAIIRKAGVMAIARAGGRVTAGDPVLCFLPPEPHVPLERV